MKLLFLNCSRIHYIRISYIHHSRYITLILIYYNVSFVNTYIQQYSQQYLFSKRNKFFNCSHIHNIRISYIHNSRYITYDTNILIYNNSAHLSTQIHNLYLFIKRNKYQLFPLHVKFLPG